MPLDANGIWQYTGDEMAAPAPVMLNRLAKSTSDALAALKASTPWTPFTPTVYNLVLGNGTTFARYKKTIDGVVHYRGRVTMGTTTTYPGGSFLFSLPFPMMANPDDRVPQGVAAVVDTDAVKFWAGVVRAALPAVDRVAINAGPTGYLIHANEPMVWAPGDSFGWNMTYEPAQP